MGSARAKLLAGWLGWWGGILAAAAIFTLLGFRWFVAAVIPCVLVMITGLRLMRSSRTRLARPAPNAMKPDFQHVRTCWNRGFIAFGRIRA